MLKKVIFLCVIFLFISCGAKTPNVSGLEVTLNEVVNDKNEAKILASDITEFSRVIKNEYRLSPYANLNNFLINIGVKKRGLCWQLAYDLINHLKKKNYSIDYYIAGANINSYFKEHNVAVLTCKKCKIEQGIIIDLWRYGGEVYFAKFYEDEKFKWKQRGGKR